MSTTGKIFVGLAPLALITIALLTVFGVVSTDALMIGSLIVSFYCLVGSIGAAFYEFVIEPRRIIQGSDPA